MQRYDANAAEDLFNGAYPTLAGWVRRLVDDDDTAHEIASEAFVRLLGRWSKVESPHSHLYWIATNLIRDRQQPGDDGERQERARDRIKQVLLENRPVGGQMRQVGDERPQPHQPGQRR